MTQDLPEAAQSHLDLNRRPNSEEILKIARQLMVKLHEAIELRGILVFYEEFITLSWHNANGQQVAVLGLRFPNSTDNTFNLDFYAAIEPDEGAVDFFGGDGFRERWAYQDSADYRHRGLISVPEEGEGIRFRFDEPPYANLPFYKKDQPDIVEHIKGAVEGSLIKLL